MSNVRIGIAGATGYGGQELLRLAAAHPQAEPVVAMASAGGDGSRELPGLRGLWGGSIEAFSLDRLVEAADAVFPGAARYGERGAGARAARPAERGSSTCRARFVSAMPRPAGGGTRRRPTSSRPPCTASRSGTGRRLRTARFVACPGCYPTAALLALKPLVAAGLVPPGGGTSTSTRSPGISGAGKKPSERTHFSEVHGSVAAYGVFAHRHAAEIEQELGREPSPSCPTWYPSTAASWRRSTPACGPGTTADEVGQALEAAYAGRPFVRLTRRSAARDQARGAHELLRHRLAGGRRAGGPRRVPGQPGEGRGGAGAAVLQRGAFGFDERAGLIP